MTFCWFAQFRDPAALQSSVSQGELASLAGFLAATPGLGRALIFTPSSTSDPYLDDGAPPQLALQLYFDDIAPLEAAAAAGGHLRGLAAHDALPSLLDANATQQAMLVRRFAVPDPTFRTSPGELPCTISSPTKARQTI